MALTKPPVLPAWAEAGDKVQPSNAEIQAGWPLSNVPPARQRWNWLLNFLANGVRYLTRRGLPDWGGDETYEIGDRVQGPDGLTYKALTQNTNKTPAANPTDWARWGFTAAELGTELNKLDAKASCRVATTANLAALSGLLTIDGVVLVAGDRVLVKDQTSPSQNGIYVVAAGAWTRAADADDGTKLTSGATVPVEAGATQADTMWMLTTDGAINVDVTALTFQQVSGGNVGTPGTYNSVTTDARGRVIAGQNFARKNPVFNPLFQVWQRGNSFAISAGTLVYTADRWFGYSSTNAITISRVAGGVGPYSLKMQRNAGQTGINAVEIGQVFETVDSLPFAGKQVAFTVRLKKGANYSGGTVRCALFTGTGTDQGALAMRNSTWTGQTTPLGTMQADVLATAGNFTVSGTIPANATQLGIYIYYIPSGTAGADDSITVEAVQIELGSSFTDFDQRLYGEELQRCLRYYMRWDQQENFIGGSSTTGTNSRSWGNFPVPMRVAPTGGVSAAGAFVVNDNSAIQTSTAVTFTSTTRNGARIDTTHAALATQRPVFCQLNASHWIDFSAEF